MAFFRASIKYRPLRVGFIVRAGHVADILKAAGINCLLWGGIHNPLIPVGDGENAFGHELVDLFSVDVLHIVESSPDGEAFAGKYPFLRGSSHLVADIFYEEWRSKKQVLALLDSKSIIDLCWEEDFKSKADDFKSDFLLLKWDATDPLANVLSLQFGFFPAEPDLKWNYEKMFVKGLHAREQVLPLGEALAMNPRKSFGPIDLTGAQLRGYGSGFPWGGNGIYIGDSSNFDDLISFWNIRAAGNNIIFLSKDYPERHLAFAQGFADFLDSLPNRHPNIEDWISLYHNVDDEALRACIAHLTFKKPILWHGLAEHAWNGLNIQPSYHVFKWQSTTMHVEPAYGKYVANVKLPEKGFLPNQDDAEVSGQHFGVTIDAYGEFGHPGYTLKPPRIRELNEYYSREIAVDPWALRVNQDGLSRIITASDESIDLYPLPKQQLVEKVFELAGLNAETSQAGLIARKIIEKIGGLEDARVLKIKGVRKILQTHSATDAITRGEATKTIFEHEFAKYQGLYIEAREKTTLNSNDVFDYLLRKDFFRAGLEMPCTQCRLVNWLTLKNIDDYWTCEYCGGVNQTSTQLKTRGDWRFRKSGLFAKDNNQEGAVPVLLALLTLKRILDHSNFAYSTALNLYARGLSCETDLAVLQYGRRDEFEIGIGECKSEGGTIDAADCKNLGEVADRLAALSVAPQVYLILAKASDSFSEEELGLFRNLAKQRELVLFTNRELELYHPYWLDNGQTEEDIPEKYPHSLGELSRNSYARYLK